MIFISIASYRDQELQATIDSLFGNAHCPEELRICVCQQDVPENYIESSDHLEVKHFLPEKSEGVGWARNIIDNMYGEEELFLQIDAHTEMVSGWDTLLKGQMELARKETSRPIVFATYPVPYELNVDGSRDTKGAYTNKTAIKFKDGLLDGLSIITKLDHPIRARYLNAGFMFGDGTFCEKIKHNPLVCYWGEEIAMTVRAYTSGFDMFHPSVHMCWHNYNRVNDSRCWDIIDDNKRSVTWKYRDAKSKDIVKNLCLGRLLGKYNLGKERSIKDFEHYAEVDFRSREVSSSARVAEWTENLK